MSEKYKLILPFHNSYLEGVVQVRPVTAFKEYEVKLDTQSPFMKTGSYYFIEGYDGNLEARMVPGNRLEKELVEEIAFALQLKLMGNQKQVTADGITVVPFIGPDRTDITPSPSAAA